MDYLADALTWVLVFVLWNVKATITVAGSLFAAVLGTTAAAEFRSDAPELTWEDIKPVGAEPAVPAHVKGSRFEVVVLTSLLALVDRLTARHGECTLLVPELTAWDLLPAETSASIPELSLWDLLPAQEEPVVREHVSSPESAATDTGCDQRVLVVAAHSVTVGGWDPDNNPGAAVLPAVVRGATVRATGRHLPAPSGDRGPGIGLVPRPPTWAAWLLAGRSVRPSVCRGNFRPTGRRLVWAAHGMSDDSPPSGFGYCLAAVCEPLLF